MLPKTNRIRSCISKGLHRVSNEASQKGLPPAFSESAFRGERIGFSPWPCLPFNGSGRAAGSDGCSAKGIRTCCHPCACPSHYGGPRRLLSGPLPVAGPVRSRPISTGPARPRLARHLPGYFPGDPAPRVSGTDWRDNLGSRGTSAPVPCQSSPVTIPSTQT